MEEGKGREIAEREEKSGRAREKEREKEREGERVKEGSEGRDEARRGRPIEGCQLSSVVSSF